MLVDTLFIVESENSMAKTTAKILVAGLSIAVLNLIAGCAAPAASTYSPLPFDEAEYAALARTGTGVVRGQVFAKTRGGDVKKGAGNKVSMMPATKYGRQRYNEEFLGGKTASVAEDSRYAGYVRSKTTDGEGRFEFTDVPPGSYYVFSSVTWETPSTNMFMKGVLVTQGGDVIGQFEVKNGAITEAILRK